MNVMTLDEPPLAAPAGTAELPDPDTCVGIVELVTDYLDGALADDTRARFEAHLADCEGCEIYLEQMRSTIEAARLVELERVAPATLDRLVTAYRATRGA
jgi:anti-sigma factor RsiW